MEKAAKITTLCMDKTGTLTEGKPKVVNVKCFNGYSEKDLILTAAIAEKNSQHPLAKAILEYALSKGIKDIPDAEDFNMMFGRGIKVKYENKSVEVSNSKVLQDESLKINKDAADYLKERSQGRTRFLIKMVW